MIRLAWHQGLLQEKSLNTFQRFAAIYWIKAVRREKIQDTEDMLQKQTWYQTPDRYDELFRTSEAYPADAMTMAGRPVEEVVDDLDVMDEYYANLEEKRGMTGADLWQGNGDDGWI